MDDKSFDRLTVAVSSAESRRSVLRAVLGAVLGSPFLGLVPDDSATADTRQGNARRDKTRGRPKDGEPSRQRGEGQEQQSERHDPIDDPALRETGDRSGEEVTVASHGCGHAGTACTGGGQCCTGKCLGNGTCSCNATNRCTPPAEPCKKAVCNDKKRCVTKNVVKGSSCFDDGNPCTKDHCDGNGNCIHPKKPNGTDCGGGQVCQDGVCTCSVDKDCQSNHCCNGTCRECCDNSHCQSGLCCNGTCHQECCDDPDCTGGRCTKDGECQDACDDDNDCHHFGGQRCCHSGLNDGYCVCPLEGQKICNNTCAFCCDNNDCTNDKTCQGGECRCPAGTKGCNGTCVPGVCCGDYDCGTTGKKCRNGQCVCPDTIDFSRDPNHCGRCDNKCLSRVCVNGVCGGVTELRCGCARLDPGCVEPEPCPDGMECVQPSIRELGRCIVLTCPVESGLIDCDGDGVCESCGACGNTTCPPNPAGGEGFCCPDGRCSCGGRCCGDCFVNDRGGEVCCPEAEVCGEVCCGEKSSCSNIGTCVGGPGACGFGPISGSSIRRR